MIYFKDGAEHEKNYPFAGRYVENHHQEGEIFRITKQYDGVHIIFSFFPLGMIQLTVDTWAELKFPVKRIKKIDTALAARIREHAGDIFDDIIEKTNRREELTPAQEHIINALANGAKLIESQSCGNMLWQDGKRPRRVDNKTLQILREKNLL